MDVCIKQEFGAPFLRHGDLKPLPTSSRLTLSLWVILFAFSDKTYLAKTSVPRLSAHGYLIDSMHVTAVRRSLFQTAELCYANAL